MSTERVIKTTFYNYHPKPGFKLRKPFETCNLLPVQDYPDYNANQQFTSFRKKHLLPANVQRQIYDWEVLGSMDLEDQWHRSLIAYESKRNLAGSSGIGRLVNTILLIDEQDFEKILKSAVKVPSLKSTYVLPPVPIIQMYRIHTNQPHSKQEAKAYYLPRATPLSSTGIEKGFIQKVRELMRGEHFRYGNIFDGFSFMGRSRQDGSSFYRYFCEYVGHKHVLLHCDKNMTPIHIDDVCLTPHDQEVVITDSSKLPCCEQFIEKVARKQRAMFVKIRSWVNQNLIPDERSKTRGYVRQVKQPSKHTPTRYEKSGSSSYFSESDRNRSKRKNDNDHYYPRDSKRSRKNCRHYNRPVIYKDCKIKNSYYY